MTEASGNIRPARAGVLPRTLPAKRGKARPCYARSTTKTGQSWKSTINESGKAAPVKCPQCGEMIVYDNRGFPSCGSCDHTFSRSEREELDSRDPEMIPALHYIERFDASARLYKKVTTMSGKERRAKRFLSKCAAGGGADGCR